MTVALSTEQKLRTARTMWKLYQTPKWGRRVLELSRTLREEKR